MMSFTLISYPLVFVCCRKVVNLQVVMKDIVMKISALLLALWYCISIVGFGLHVCRGTDRTYVSSFIEGTSCHDIHPEHNCGKGNCNKGNCKSGHLHAHEEGTCIESESCCTDEYKVLSVTCEFPDNGNRHHVKCLTSFIPYICNPNDLLCCQSMRLRSIDVSGLLRSIIVFADIQSAFSVWRI